ncbi:hypothetical protein [Amycolatopsis sp. cmx-4-54]|uniref:hypothetical protein n=1 Tax=Amycolatopsis sp. cmx-4-54 TaxID=2790936 RepID=UPI00397CD0A8
MLQAAPGQGAEALVAVHYAADGGLYPDTDNDETMGPDGYALVTFGIAGSIDHETAWLRHRRIVVDRFGPWLTDQELRWS